MVQWGRGGFWLSDEKFLQSQPTRQGQQQDQADIERKTEI